MDDPRKKLVAHGYDKVAESYLAWSAKIAGDPRRRFIEEFSSRLTQGDKVLELGCGAGELSTRLLAQRFDVVGVDLSGEQLNLARANLPGTSFIHGDLATVDFPSESFDGVAATYSISHVPREEHPELFQRIAAWLRPGGLFLASLGTGDNPGSTNEWLGVPMFFSGYDAETNRRLLRESGFRLLLDDLVEMREPEGLATFLWIIAVKI